LLGRRYWARFILTVTLGILAGLIVGEIVQASTEVEGWGVVGAAIGLVVALVVFLWSA
jgi:heme/copper-type cytochrome/quinol oxidase subunit 4